MKLVIISGRSGSGKSGALNQLEDEGYYCIDNLPLTLLADLVRELSRSQQSEYHNTAVCIDARNTVAELANFDAIVNEIRPLVDLQIVVLDADDQTLVKRFSETRRRHPLSNKEVALAEALRDERARLEPIVSTADLTIDTSGLTIHQLRTVIKERVIGGEAIGMTVQLMSFGFKRGLPVDADFVFDLRMLPNPHWDESLRPQTGLDEGVQTFLNSKPEVERMHIMISEFLFAWLPELAKGNRSYVTVALGCTGGQHRSVYMAERLAQVLTGQPFNLQVRHRELQDKKNA
ncbi:RNase adapter RapZ [Litorivivens sp.]|uniref:RNase adapter RapZ n=1 Tax=Litorivivens sp. TaxID=2020868 RepID=UPI0035674AB8